MTFGRSTGKVVAGARGTRERYNPGYTPNAVAFMTRRTAETHAAFFLQHLQAGVNVLDCGCGPGTITAGIAAAVAPGTVVGLDKEPGQVALAKRTVAERGRANIRFVAASIYALPFRPQSFDAVFSHALMEHLAEPVTALREMRRVLRPGGLAALCSPDWSAFIVAPSHPDVNKAIAFYTDLQERNGGNPNVGRRLGALMEEAGFSAIEMSARYECYESLEVITEFIAQRLERAEEVDGVVQAGLPDAADLQRMIRALREWSAQKGRLFAQAWVSAIGRV